MMKGVRQGCPASGNRFTMAFDPVFQMAVDLCPPARTVLVVVFTAMRLYVRRRLCPGYCFVRVFAHCCGQPLLSVIVLRARLPLDLA